MASAINTQRIDYINIGLLLLSCALAFVIPFELFLFAYGVLGPLHYLTEISWLHDKNYYATDKHDVIVLLIISFLLTIFYVLSKHNPNLILKYFSIQTQVHFQGHLIFIAFGSALFFAFIKKPVIKIIGVIVLILLTFVSSYFIVFFTVFLPTLIHVFLFTSIFMLYGAIKSKSKMGYFTVVLHIVCPFLLFFLFPSQNLSGTKGMDMFINSDFSALNKFIYGNYFIDSNTQMTEGNFMGMVFNSKYGIAIMRFIAFAYMYHYLNWFSKTEIIRWHQVPKARFVIVLFGWLVSVVLYAIDYALGFQWLYLLSFMHVLLEFPLNYKSFVGIFSALGFEPTKKIA
jgi:hypothetical protein